MARVLDTTADALASAHETIIEQEREINALHFIVGALSEMVTPDKYSNAVVEAVTSGRVVPASIRAEVGL